MTKTRRIMGMVLVFAMLCTIVLFQSGCGADKGNTPTSADTAAGSDASAATTAAKPAEPVTLTIIGPNVSDAQQGVQDDPVAKEIERATGVRMDLTAANAVADINVKLAAMIASADMADVTFFGTNDLMQSAVTANVLLPLDDLIDQYGVNLKKNLSFMLQYSKTNQSVGKNGVTDGKTYVIGGFPVGLYGYDTQRCNNIPFVRWDLYKKLGYPEINTIDDFIPLMKQMVALEPKTAEGKKVYATGSAMGGSAWSGDSCLWGNVPGTYGFSVNTYANVVDMLSNEFVDFVGDPNSKFFAGAKFWNQVYREGLLDPESFTMKGDNFKDKIKQGRYVFVYGGQNTAEFNLNQMAAGEKEKYFEQLPPPKDAEAVWLSADQPVGTPTNGIAISKNCKYPEAAMRLIDYLGSYEGCTTIDAGVKGDTWDIIDGKPQLKPGVAEQELKEGMDFDKAHGIGKYWSMVLMGDFVKNPEYDTFINLFLAVPAQQTPADKDLCEHYGVKNPLELVTRQVKQSIGSAPENALIPSYPGDIQDLSNNVDKYVFDNFIKLILAKTESDYLAVQASFIEGVNKSGNQKVLEWLRAERVKAVEKYKTMGFGN